MTRPDRDSVVITPEHCTLDDDGAYTYNRGIRTRGAHLIVRGMPLLIVAEIINTSGGDIHTNGGHIYTNGGNVYTQGGSINTHGGYINTQGGDIDTQGGYIDTQGGYIDTDGGNIDTQGGRVDTHGGHINTKGGYLETMRGTITTSGGAINGVPAPSIATQQERIRQVLDALDHGGKLNMDAWHTCATTHCIAGWLQHLSTDDRVKQMPPPTAGAALCPAAVPRFVESDEAAMAWMREFAH